MWQTARSKQQGSVHQWVCHAIQLPAPRGSLYPKYASAGCPSVTWCQGSSQGFLQGRQGTVPRSPHSSNAARVTPRCSPRPALSVRQTGWQTGWQKGWQDRKIRESVSRISYRGDPVRPCSRATHADETRAVAFAWGCLIYCRPHLISWRSTSQRASEPASSQRWRSAGKKAPHPSKFLCF